MFRCLNKNEIDYIIFDKKNMVQGVTVFNKFGSPKE